MALVAEVEGGCRHPDKMAAVKIPKFRRCEIYVSSPLLEEKKYTYMTRYERCANVKEGKTNLLRGEGLNRRQVRI